MPSLHLVLQIAKFRARMGLQETKRKQTALKYQSATQHKLQKTMRARTQSSRAKWMQSSRAKWKKMVHVRMRILMVTLMSVGETANLFQARTWRPWLWTLRTLRLSHILSLISHVMQCAI